MSWIHLLRVSVWIFLWIPFLLGKYLGLCCKYVFNQIRMLVFDFKYTAFTVILYWVLISYSQQVWIFWTTQETCKHPWSSVCPGPQAGIHFLLRYWVYDHLSVLRHGNSVVSLLLSLAHSLSWSEHSSSWQGRGLPRGHPPPARCSRWGTWKEPAASPVTLLAPSESREVSRLERGILRGSFH